jgi:hypothetical protein
VLDRLRARNRLDEDEAMALALGEIAAHGPGMRPTASQRATGKPSSQLLRVS